MKTVKNVYKDITWCSRSKECENDECSFRFDEDQELNADEMFGIDNYDRYESDRCDDNCGYVIEDLTVDTNLNGSISISTVINDRLVTRTYYDYDELEAKQIFSMRFKDE